MDDPSHLPLPGLFAQIVHDEAYATSPGASRLSFYLDGAHTPESMATCAAWFAGVIGAPLPMAEPASTKAGSDSSGGGGGVLAGSAQSARPDSAADGSGASRADGAEAAGEEELQRVLMFNCMKERDPRALLPELQASLAARGVRMDHALFVPPDSHYGFLASSATKDLASAINADVSWQQQLRSVWQECNAAGVAAQGMSAAGKPLPLPPVPSLPGGCGAVSARVWVWVVGGGVSAHMGGWTLDCERCKLKSAALCEHRRPATDAAAPRLAHPAPQPAVTTHAGAAVAAAAAAVQVDSARVAVMPGVERTVEWLRSCVKARPRLKLQVLVTGSLYLVGDTLRTLGKAPN